MRVARAAPGKPGAPTVYRPVRDAALVALVAAALGIIACDDDEKARCDSATEPCVTGDGFALVEGTVTRSVGGGAGRGR